MCIRDSEYSGASSTPEFILVTFTTNKTPGGGADGDAIFIDDVELIYNSPAGINEIDLVDWVSYVSEKGLLFSEGFNIESEIKIYSTTGQMIRTASVQELKGTQLKSGFYIITHRLGSYKVLAH